MQYLVTMESVDAGPLLPPQQVAGLIRQVILPGLEACAKLQEEGKILGGGTLAGARAAAFVMEADSNEELNALLQGLPFWGLMKADVVPLLSFESRIEHDRQTLEHLEATPA